jgi:hypothetical protein
MNNMLVIKLVNLLIVAIALWPTFYASGIRYGTSPDSVTRQFWVIIIVFGIICFGMAYSLCKKAGVVFKSKRWQDGPLFNWTVAVIWFIGWIVFIALLAK